MLQKRKQRRRRISFQQSMREIGPGLRTAFRRARVALWRFKRSPEQRDRAAMYGTFAFIALFAVGSVDAIITGGADFAPGSAYASEYTPTRVTMLVQPPTEIPEVASAPSEATKSAGDLDYSFTTETLLGGPEAEFVAVEAPAVAEIDFESLKTADIVADVAMDDTSF